MNMLEAGGYLSVDNFNVLCLWLNWCCTNNWRVAFTSPKQMFTLDKISTAVSSTAFVHMRRYNQHKMTVPRRDLKYRLNNTFLVTNVMKTPSALFPYS